MPNVLEHCSQSSRFSKLKYNGRMSLVKSCPTNIPLPLHTHIATYKHTVKNLNVLIGLSLSGSVLGMSIESGQSIIQADHAH